MKKILSMFVILASFFMFPKSIFGVCESKELNDWAEDVKVIFENQYHSDSYEDENGNMVEGYEPEFSYLLYLSPVKDNLKVYVTDSISNERIEVEYDKDYKNYVMGSYIHFKTKKYTIEIYDNSKECKGEKLKTIEYSVPPFNEYSQTVYCKENKDEDICKTYSDNENIDPEEAEKIINEYSENKTKTFWEKVLDVLIEYGLYVIVPIAIVSMFYIIKIKKYKKKEDAK